MKKWSEVMSSQPNELTQLLRSWGEGNRGALEELLPLVHAELRRLARRHMNREGAGHTLQTSALINEAYIKLAEGRGTAWQDRTHFFAVAARVMRQILIDHARARHYAKRGGGAHKVSLDEAADATEQRAAELVALDEALEGLATLDQRKARIVELHFFGGLSIKETADVMGLSTATVDRELRSAKAWLRRELGRGE